MEIGLNPSATAGRMSNLNIPLSSENRQNLEDSRPPEDRVDNIADFTEKSCVSDTRKEVPSKSADADSYHYKPDFPVECINGKWVMQLPNAKIPMPAKPVWLDTMDKTNRILDGSSNPVFLREMADDIKKTADESYHKMGVNFSGEVFDEILNRTDSGEHLANLKQIYQLRFDNETQSTNRVGGALAGTLCSEMNKYGKILPAIEKRMKAL